MNKEYISERLLSFLDREVSDLESKIIDLNSTIRKQKLEIKLKDTTLELQKAKIELGEGVLEHQKSEIEKRDTTIEGFISKIKSLESVPSKAEEKTQDLPKILGVTEDGVTVYEGQNIDLFWFHKSLSSKIECDSIAKYFYFKHEAGYSDYYADKEVCQTAFKKWCSENN